uniref:tRNA (guanine(9)-N(1))-methyltransferase n=1 Tax=Parastrongyloides trichosuri TaxID=131310 RepID=A0A0N4ZYN1_PARTI
MNESQPNETVCINTSDVEIETKKIRNELPNPLSKKQQKREEQRKRYLEKRKEKRVLERQRKKDRNRIMRENNIPIPSRKQFKKMSNSNCKIRVAIDMSFDEYMSDVNIKATMVQLQFCYGYNRRAENPLQLHIVGLQGKGNEEFLKQSDNDSWDVHSTTKPLTEVFTKEELVYLTADSENNLEDIEDDKVYVIGGLLDHNSCPKLTLDIANKAGIKHAKLPIGDYMKLKTRNVLTINQVYEIILRYTESKNWEKAFFDVIPRRKGIIKIDKFPEENKIDDVNTNESC